MNRHFGAVVCTVAGHRWQLVDDAETHVGKTVMRCNRCKSESIVSAETFQAEGYADRAMRQQVSELPIFDPRDIDPRIRGRRR